MRARCALRLPQYAHDRRGAYAEFGWRIAVLRHVAMRETYAAAKLLDETKDLENRGLIGVAVVGVATLAISPEKETLRSTTSDSVSASSVSIS